MFDISYFTDYVIRLGATRLGQTLYSICVGVVGTLILVGFLSSFMAPTAMDALLPFIIGFNTALTGYNVIEKTRGAFRHRRLVAVGAGLTVVLVAAAAMNLIFWRLAGIGLVSMGKFWILIIVGSVASWLGGVLAIKYLKLN